eukprot:TRINITY_DN755_c0_g1_i2.p1 TRINITY_DN755_c0_g1~~TRINITY_DN755_c0_g1_i2.p1  ORF type:complete len:740 (-),score=107.06 TRINITY_DN755_c0_g1_i2:56-2275(-)
MILQGSFWIALIAILGGAESGSPWNNCSVAPFNGYPYCNWTLSTAARVDDLVSRMTADQMYPQMLNTAPAIPELGIPAYQWWSEALHGVNSNCGTRCPTSFPAASCLGASFNMSLIRAISKAISDEARSLHNQLDVTTGQGPIGLDFWAPNININRDPRWGRNQEVPSEDPFITSQYVANFVKGMQEGDDTRYLKTVATCKHYAAYSLENWHNVTRYEFNAVVSDSDLVETYLPAWEACIQIGGAKSIMCSYNAVNGIPTCASDFLLQTIVRDEWQFDGYVVSDCDAIDCIMNYHHYTSTPAETCAVAVKAGTDLNCGNFYSNIPSALDSGLLNEADLAQSMRRLFTQRFALGLFDPVEIQSYTKIGPDVVDSEAHRLLALEAARESIVLLQNDNNILPLSKGMKVAVIGPNSNVTETLLSNYHGARCLDGTYDCVISPIQAILNMGVKATWNYGCSIDGTDDSGFDDAVQAAVNADVAVVFLGIDNSIEREGLDRVNITLPGVQDQLIQKIYAAQKNIVVVLINGGAVAIKWISDNIPGIIEAFYPGENGAQAIAEVLFGDYNPGGKMPYTIYPAEFVDQISLEDMSMSDYPGRTYKYYSLEPIFPFGWGLSYTTFSILWENGTNEMTSEGQTYFRANVTNIGDRAGDEVVLAFVGAQEQGGPIRRLFGFERVHLMPGESRQVYFFATAETFSTVDEKGNRWQHPGNYQITIGNGVQEISKMIKIEGEATLLHKFART